MNVPKVYEDGFLEVNILQKTSFYVQLDVESFIDTS